MDRTTGAARYRAVKTNDRPSKVLAQHGKTHTVEIADTTQKTAGKKKENPGKSQLIMIENWKTVDAAHSKDKNSDI
uniref:Uncharacterized protein n=1 Tax=Romanomermis culicivorax TaxID=13658 RepID=A0A915K496_ROMCU